MWTEPMKNLSDLFFLCQTANSTIDSCFELLTPQHMSMDPARAVSCSAPSMPHLTVLDRTCAMVQLQACVL